MSTIPIIAERDEILEALQSMTDAVVPVIVLINADPYRAGIGHTLLMDYLPKLSSALAKARRAMKP